MNNSIKFFDGIERQYTPGEILPQIDLHKIFTTQEQALDPVFFKKWHKKWHYCKAFYQEPHLTGFCDVMRVTEKIGLLLYLLSKNIIFTTKCISRTS